MCAPHIIPMPFRLNGIHVSYTEPIPVTIYFNHLFSNLTSWCLVSIETMYKHK